MSEKEPFFSTEVEVPKLSERPKVPLSEMTQEDIRGEIYKLIATHKALKAGRRGSDLLMATKNLQKLGVYLKLRFKLPDLVYIDQATNELEKYCPITEVVLPERPVDQNRQKTFFRAPTPALVKASEPTNPKRTAEQVREKAKKTPPPPPPTDAQQTGDEEIIEIEDDWIVDDDIAVEMDSDPESSQKLQQVLQERMPATDFEGAKTVVRGLQEAGGPQLGEMLGQDELPEEFRGSAINNALDREMQNRELKVRMGKMIYEAFVEGGGMEFEQPEKWFDKVEEEGPWGLRKVEWFGKFNYIDRENRLIHPKEHDLWFDAVPEDGFRERQLYKRKKKFPSELVLVVALVKVKGVHKFITPEGQVLDPTEETMEAYFRDPDDDGWSDISIDMPDPIPPQNRFLDSLSGKIDAYAERFAKDDPKTYKAFTELAQNLTVFKEGDPDWETALLSAESLVKESDLETGDKVHYYRQILEEAAAAKMEIEFKFASSVSSRHWVDIDRYHNGTVVRLHNGEVKYNLMNDQGQLIYPEDEAFDYIDQFMGDVARVSRNGKWHFISRHDGRLLEEDESQWFAEIYKAKNGMFRLKGVDGRYRFATTSGELIKPYSGFKEASDFSSNGKATVVFTRDEFEIDRQGDRVTLLSQQVSDFVGKLLGSFTATHRPKDRLIGGETPLDLPPHATDRKPHATGDSSWRISSLFSELLKASGSLKETLELMKLFQGFREVLQEENEKKSKPQIVLLLLRNRIQKSELTASVKEKLERFVKKLKYETKMKWVQQPPLSVNFLDYFKGHLTENSDNEELIRLLRKLESWFICTRMGEGSSGSLLKNLKQVINQSGLDSKAKTRLKTAVTLMLGDPAIQKGMNFGQGFSMDRYHKLLQSRRARQRQITSGVPVHITPLQKKVNEQALNQELDGLCRMLQIEAEGAKKGKLKGLAVDTFKQFHNLVRKNPQHSFDRLKFGIALENLAYAIEKYIEFEDVPESDKPILRIKKHEAVKLAIDVFEGALKRAKSPETEASVQRHLGICKAVMNMNKEARDHMKASLAISEDPVLREEFDVLRLSVRSRLRKVWIFRVAALAAAGYAAMWFYEASEPHRVRTRVQECLVAAKPCPDLADVNERFRVLMGDGQADKMLLLKSEMRLGNKMGVSQVFTELFSKNKQNLSLQLELFNLFKGAEKLEDLQQTMGSIDDLELETEGDVKVKPFISILLDLEKAKSIKDKNGRRKALQQVVVDAETLGRKLHETDKGIELWSTTAGIHEELGNKKRAQEIREALEKSGEEAGLTKVEKPGKKPAKKSKKRKRNTKRKK